MKKIIMLLGIVAFMAACTGNTNRERPTQEEGTEAPMDQNEGMDQTMPEENMETEEPDTSITPVPAP